MAIPLTIQLASLQASAESLNNSQEGTEQLGTQPWPDGWLECCPMNQKMAGSIPGQGTYLGSGFDGQSGHMWEVAD